ncbi:MAG: glycosyltransferase [Elusimicrobia bacterium]|nr:glycosyltransferase [Elusimicrobiota bacterium]
MVQDKIKNHPSFSLILPFYNEEKVAGAVIENYWQSLKKENLSFELILVNNGSGDHTGAILQDWVNSHPEDAQIVQIQTNQGYGWGILQGAAAATGRWLVMAPGDGELGAGDLISALVMTERVQALAAKGKRISRSDGMVRSLVSKIYNGIFHLLFPRVAIDDINGWPKVIARDLWYSLGLVSKDWFIDAEIILKLTKRNIPIMEAPFAMQRRKGGSSHVALGTIVEFFKNLARWKLTGGKPWKIPVGQKMEKINARR